MNMALHRGRVLPVPIFLVLALYAGQSVAATNNNTIPDADDKVMEEKFQEYSLPYGVLGAISHILNIWVMGCHFYGRTPLWPTRHLRVKYSLFNMLSTIGSSLVSMGIVIFTLSKIQETQPLIILASLQIVLSLMLDAVNVHRYFAIRCRAKYEKIGGGYEKFDRMGLLRGMVLWGTILYGVSYTSIYAIAQMSKSKRLEGRFDPLGITLVVMVCGSALVAFISLIVWLKTGRPKANNGSTLHVLVLSGLICSLGYFLTGDYGVAVLTGNTIGLAIEKHRVLYWVFFMFERVPMFTF